MGQTTRTAHYTDYGVGVSVPASPADDTEDFRDLLKQRGGAGLPPSK
ncbi:hypothetical protein [Streptomyces sp. NPDC003697]